MKINDMPQKEIIFSLEGTLDEIHGKMEGGLLVKVQGHNSELMNLLFSGMRYEPRIAAMMCALVSLYNLKKAAGDIDKPAPNKTTAFLELMRADPFYCAEITRAVVEFWQGAGVDVGALAEMVKKKIIYKPTTYV
jgi:hypothetical protein